MAMLIAAMPRPRAGTRSKASKRQPRDIERRARQKLGDRFHGAGPGRAVMEHKYVTQGTGPRPDWTSARTKGRRRIIPDEVEGPCIQQGPKEDDCFLYRSVSQQRVRGALERGKGERSPKIIVLTLSAVWSSSRRRLVVLRGRRPAGNGEVDARSTLSLRPGPANDVRGASVRCSRG